MWTTKQKDAFLKKKVRDVFAIARDEILQLTAGAYAARVRAAVLEGAWKYMAHRSVEIVED